MGHESVVQARKPTGLGSTPPTVRPGIVERPALLQLIDDAVARHRVVLVQAPSGYGKTAAVAGWVRRHGGPVAWVTLTALESTPALVDVVVTDALRRVGEADTSPPGVETLRHLPGPGAGPEARWLALRTALGGLTSPVVLVVDDLDAAPGSLEDSLLAALVESGPALLRIVLVGKQRPPLRLAKLEVGGQLGRIDVADVRFRLAETRELARTLGRELPEDRLHALQRWTGGWPVAVHLGLLDSASARLDGGEPPPAVSPALVGLVVENVLAALPPHLVDLVLATTTLDWVDPETAVRLTGRPDAGHLLDECVRRGLFVERHQVEGVPRYRWHPVFSELCRAVLRERDPARACELERAAARALADQGHFLHAVEHARRAGDTEMVHAMLRSRWLWAVLEARAPEAARLFSALATDNQDDPALILAHACVLDVTGDRSGARLRYEQAKAAVAAHGPAEAARVDAMRALAELFLADSAEVLAEAVDTVLATIKAGGYDDASIRAAALFVAGWTELRLRRDPPHAVALLRLAATECERTGQPTIAARARTNLAFAAALTGDLGTALAELAAAGGRDVPAGAWTGHDGGIVDFTRGFVAFYRHELDAAERCLRAVLTARPAGGYSHIARLYLVQTLVATGDLLRLDEAEAELAKVPAGEEHGLPWGYFRTASVAVVEAARGRSAQAAALLRDLPPMPRAPIVGCYVARVLEQVGDPASAAAALDQVGSTAPPFARAHALVTRALLHLGDGKSQAAHDALEQALELAAPQDAVWPFTRDERITTLLEDHGTWGTRHEGFVARLLAALADGPAVDVLSPREQEVLAHLRTDMTTAEIADALFVSVNTVKTHLRAIYRKLGVSGRREAVRVRVPTYLVRHR